MLDHDLGLEVETRRETEILMRRPRITIDAAMFTPSIRIETHLEPDIRAIVLSDDAPRRVGKVFRRRPAQTLQILVVTFDLLEIKLSMSRLESVGRVDPRPAPATKRNVRLAHRFLTGLNHFFTA